MPFVASWLPPFPGWGRRAPTLFSSLVLETSPQPLLKLFLALSIRCGHPILKRFVFGEEPKLSPASSGAKCKFICGRTLPPVRAHHYAWPPNTALVTLLYNLTAFTIFSTITYERKYIFHCKSRHTDVYIWLMQRYRHIPMWVASPLRHALWYLPFCAILFYFVHLFILSATQDPLNWLRDLLSNWATSRCWNNMVLINSLDSPLPHPC